MIVLSIVWEIDIHVTPPRAKGKGEVVSYSTCLNCNMPVSYYEKYCMDCEKTYHQDRNFWKDKRIKADYGTPEYNKEVSEHLAKDLI